MRVLYYLLKKWFLCSSLRLSCVRFLISIHFWKSFLAYLVVFAGRKNGWRWIWYVWVPPQHRKFYAAPPKFPSTVTELLQRCALWEWYAARKSATKLIRWLADDHRGYVGLGCTNDRDVFLSVVSTRSRKWQTKPCWCKLFSIMLSYVYNQFINSKKV